MIHFMPWKDFICYDTLSSTLGGIIMSQCKVTLHYVQHILIVTFKHPFSATKMIISALVKF